MSLEEVISSNDKVIRILILHTSNTSGNTNLKSTSVRLILKQTSVDGVVETNVISLDTASQVLTLLYYKKKITGCLDLNTVFPNAFLNIRLDESVGWKHGTFSKSVVDWNVCICIYNDIIPHFMYYDIPILHYPYSSLCKAHPSNTDFSLIFFSWSVHLK